MSRHIPFLSFLVPVLRSSLLPGPWEHDQPLHILSPLWSKLLYHATPEGLADQRLQSTVAGSFQREPWGHLKLRNKEDSLPPAEVSCSPPSLIWGMSLGSGCLTYVKGDS